MIMMGVSNVQGTSDHPEEALLGDSPDAVDSNIGPGSIVPNAKNRTRKWMKSLGGSMQHARINAIAKLLKKHFPADRSNGTKPGVADYSIVSNALLKENDRCLVEAGDVIPIDGEIIEGVAFIDESAITGESAPVIRESGGERSAVLGGTSVLSDWIIMRVRR